MSASGASSIPCSSAHAGYSGFPGGNIKLSFKRCERMTLVWLGSTLQQQHQGLCCWPSLLVCRAVFPWQNAPSSLLCAVKLPLGIQCCLVSISLLGHPGFSSQCLLRGTGTRVTYSAMHIANVLWGCGGGRSGTAGWFDEGKQVILNTLPAPCAAPAPTTSCRSCGLSAVGHCRLKRC